MLLLNFTVPADLLCIFYILLGLFFCRDIFYFAYSNVFRAEALFIQLALNIVEFECSCNNVNNANDDKDLLVLDFFISCSLEASCSSLMERTAYLSLLPHRDNFNNLVPC